MGSPQNSADAPTGVPVHSQKIEIGNGDEVIYILGVDPAWGASVAIADIRQSQPHKHLRTYETYVLLAGALEVFVDGVIYTLETPGDTVEIPLGFVHWARALGEAPGRIMVITTPPWTHEDHIMVDAAENRRQL